MGDYPTDPRHAEWQVREDPNKNTPDFQQDSSEQLVAQSSFDEWRRLNGSANPDPDNLVALEKAASYDMVFREGLNKLIAELRDPIDNETKLIDKLELPKLKAELDSLREIRDTAALGKREEEVANIFQKAISQYPYSREGVCHPAEILSKKETNCVGASVLGGALLDNVGIKYLVGNIGDHVLLIVITNDNRVLWQDMQDGKERPELANKELTAEKIEGKTANGENITPADIIAFADHPNNNGLGFHVKKERWEDKLMIVSPPESGLEAQLLINTGFPLGNAGRNREAIEILEIAAQKAPGNPDVYQGLARAYKNLGLYGKAVNVFKKALEIDPTSEYFKGVMAELVALAHLPERGA